MSFLFFIFHFFFHSKADFPRSIHNLSSSLPLFLSPFPFSSFLISFIHLFAPSFQNLPVFFRYLFLERDQCQRIRRLIMLMMIPVSRKFEDIYISIYPRF
ncbi:hypothetical protein DFH27DRAFT_547625 [Peziza echinospora]|nr:hypothetical protein DFH27DRAFT_547625 [Peziza echinospora]